MHREDNQASAKLKFPSKGGLRQRCEKKPTDQDYLETALFLFERYEAMGETKDKAKS